MRRFLFWPGHSWLSLLARFYLAFVFIAACLHKIAYPATFALDVATYDVLPLQLVNIMAIVLPYLELVVAIMLLVGFRVKAAALVISGMMVMFVVALILALQKGLDISCGCFASQTLESEDPISWLTVLRDLAWLACSGYVVFFDRTPLGVDRWLANRQAKNHG